MQPIILDLFFGTEQVIMLDALLEEMRVDGHVVDVKKTKKEDNTTRYEIEFTTIASVYFFGHKQGSSNFFDYLNK